MNLDGADSPLAHDESLQQFLKPSATGRIRDALLIDTSQLCGQGPDGVKGHDSIRILFRSIAKGLEPKLLLALPLRQGPRRKRGESSLLGMLTSCNYTSEKALCTDDVRAALKRNGKEKQVDLPPRQCSFDRRRVRASAHRRWAWLGRGIACESATHAPRVQRQAQYDLRRRCERGRTPVVSSVRIS